MNQQERKHPRLPSLEERPRAQAQLEHELHKELLVESPELRLLDERLPLVQPQQRVVPRDPDHLQPLRPRHPWELEQAPLALRLRPWRLLLRCQHERTTLPEPLQLTLQTHLAQQPRLQEPEHRLEKSEPLVPEELPATQAQRRFTLEVLRMD